MLIAQKLIIHPGNLTQLCQLRPQHDSVTIVIDVGGLIVTPTMTPLITELKRRHQAADI